MVKAKGNSDVVRCIPTFLKKLLDWDIRVTDTICSSFAKYFGHEDFQETPLKLFEYSSDGAIWTVLLVATSFISKYEDVKQFAVNIFVAFSVDLIVVSIIKSIVRRRRPAASVASSRVKIDAVDQFSFPSGHVSRTVLACTLIFKKYDPAPWARAILVSWAAGVSVSRMLLRRHYLLDILSGAVIGFSGALLFSRFWLSPEAANSFVLFFL